MSNFSSTTYDIEIPNAQLRDTSAPATRVTIHRTESTLYSYIRKSRYHVKNIALINIPPYIVEEMKDLQLSGEEITYTDYNDVSWIGYITGEYNISKRYDRYSLSLSLSVREA